MNFYIFYREDDNFNDILKDKNIKKLFQFKLKYLQHLMLGASELPDDIKSYILLKYGDDLENHSDIFIDRKPKINVDYIPDPNRPEKFKKL